MSLFNLNNEMLKSMRIPTPHISELGPQVLGVAAWNSMVAHNSTSRTVMDSNHIASPVSLLTPEKKKSLISGVEYELGKYIDDFKVDDDSIVVGIIQKIIGDPNNPKTGIFLEYERDGELWLDYLEVPTYKTKHSFFGYPIHKTEEMKDLTYGSPVTSGTVLGKTNSLNDGGCWMPGLNANVAFMTVPETGEDGIMVSESFCDGMKFTSVTSRVAYLDRNTMPVNVHGDDDVFKMFPDLGEYVREGYPLFATRDRNDMFITADLNNKNIKEIDWNFDNLQYTGAPNSRVIDIEVVRGSNIKPVYSESMTKQLDYWYEINVSYAKRTINQYETLLRDYRNKFGASFTPRETGRLIIALRDHMVMEATETERRKTSHDDHVIDQYRVKITVESIIRPNVGYKLTGIHGDRYLSRYIVIYIWYLINCWEVLRDGSPK